jgi:hypothetical protein
MYSRELSREDLQFNHQTDQYIIVSSEIFHLTIEEYYLTDRRTAL